MVLRDSISVGYTCRFSSFATECSYDYFFVYDGDTHDAPLIAALSGSILPDPIYSSGTSMLIVFYSDVNYHVDGFNAVFESVGMHECAPACLQLGDCDNRSICSGITPPVTGPPAVQGKNAANAT